MSGADLGPLDWRIAIVDAHGRPTPEFQRRWTTQRGNNGLIGVTLGSGAPTGTPVDGQEYADISVSPIVLYIGSAGAWVKVGLAKFTDLSDVPHSYTGAAQKVVRVNSGANGLEFASVAFGFAWDRPIASITISQPVRYFDAGIAWTLKASPSGGSHTAQIDGTGPTSSTVFTILQNSTTIGSFTFASGATSATFSISADVSIGNTDTVKIVAPSNLNAMSGNIYGTIRGERP